MTKDIAVIGLMHSGKSTFAKVLVEQGYQRIAFADPVKEISAQMLTAFQRYLNNSTTTERGAYTYEDMNRLKGQPAIRKLLQLVGTELGREWHGPDTLWIDIFEKKVRTWYAEGALAPIVNDDCRFPNEAERLRKLGFVLVKLVRPEDERFRSVVDALTQQYPEWSPQEVWKAAVAFQDHPSETNVNKIVPDITIANTSIDELRACAYTLATGEAYATDCHGVDHRKG